MEILANHAHPTGTFLVVGLLPVHPENICQLSYTGMTVVLTNLKKTKTRLNDGLIPGQVQEGTSVKFWKGSPKCSDCWFQKILPTLQNVNVHQTGFKRWTKKSLRNTPSCQTSYCLSFTIEQTDLSQTVCGYRIYRFLPFQCCTLFQ